MLETKPNHYSQVGPFILVQNGKKILEANQNKDGELDGKWRTWNEKGELTSEGMYEQGKEEGVWLVRESPEGPLQRKEYKQGVLQSP